MPTAAGTFLLTTFFVLTPAVKENVMAEPNITRHAIKVEHVSSVLL